MTHANKVMQTHQFEQIACIKKANFWLLLLAYVHIFAIYR